MWGGGSGRPGGPEDHLVVPAGPPPAQSLPVMTMAELTVEWRGKPCSAPATAFQRWLGLSYLPGLAWAGLVSSSDHSTPTRGETESLRDKRELTLSPPALPAGSDWGVWPGLVSIKVVVEERRGEGRVAPSSLQSQRAPDWLSLVRRKTLTEKIKLRI